MLGLARMLMCVSVALVVALGCSSTYDTDNLRVDGGGNGNDDAGGGNGADARADQPDADPAQPDADEGEEADAAVDCGAPGEMCCSEDVDSCNGDYYECSGGICEECGASGAACCTTPPACQGSLLGCPIGLLCL
jgi:hypothetical protein